MNIVTLRSFDNYFPAHITLTKLQDAGIECYLKDEHTVTINPVMGHLIGGIKLVIKDQDLAAATALLQAFDEAYRQSVKCPRCNAAAFNRVTNPTVPNYLVIIATWFFSNYAPPMQQVYVCGQCGYRCSELPNTVNEEDLHE
jgi:Putative prokaryotic signal transducing protein